MSIWCFNKNQTENRKLG